MALPEPALPKIGQTYNIIVTGVGGTGIVTIGGILGMAAHLEGKGVGVIDMAGLAQKGGAVYSHMRIAERPEDIHAIRVAAGGADLVLGGDIVVAGNKKVLAAVKPGRTAMIVNTAEFLPGDFTRNADFSLPTERLKRAIAGAAGREQTHFVDASRLATALFGSSLGANIFMVGYAYQLGALPLSADADRAGDRAERRGGGDEPRGVPLGPPRRARSAAVEALAKPAAEERDENRTLSQSFEETVERRVAFLTAYQNAAYAARYRALVEQGEGRGGRQGARQVRARRGGGALSVQADGLQGRVRGGAALHRRQFPQAGGQRARRRQSALRIPSRAAAARAPRSGDRRAAQDELRAVDDERVQAAGAAEVPARHAVRHLRLFRRSARPSAS